jgi:signal transduction histidine kinase
VKDRFSLRTRLLLAVGAITLVAFVLADFVVYNSIHSDLIQQVDTSLETSHVAVEATADNPTTANHTPGGPSPQSPDQPVNSSSFCAVGRETAPGMFIEVLNKQHHVVTSAAGLEKCPAFQPGSQSYTPKLPVVITGFSDSGPNPNEPTVYFTVPSTTPSGPAFRVRASVLTGGGVLVVAQPIGGVANTLSQLLAVELLVTAGALITAVLLGIWLVRVGLRPLADIERTADAIAGGDLKQRVANADAPTEVGHLATAFNFMLERIQDTVGELTASEHRLRRFVGDASHELRTPIAAVSAYAQLFNHGIASRPEELRRVMTGIERESGRMGRLVEDLLVLAKLDEHQVSVVSDPVEIVGLVAESAETARVTGPAWPIVLEADEPIEVIGNRDALRQVFDNILANVRAHTPEGTRTTLAISRETNLARIDVSDTGPGLSDEEALLVFERFFRVDPSRTREGGGGSGLGLSIVAAIVAAHGGRVEARRGSGGGAIFSVYLPSSSGNAVDENQLAAPISNMSGTNSASGHDVSPLASAPPE